MSDPDEGSEPRGDPTGSGGPTDDATEDTTDESADWWAPRWRGQQGRLEVWYATATDTETGTGIWVHGETVARTPGASEAPDTTGDGGNASTYDTRNVVSHG